MNHYAKIRNLEDISNLYVLHTCAHDNDDIKKMNKVTDEVYFGYEIEYCVLATKHFCSYCQAKNVEVIPEYLLACYCTYDDPVSKSLIAEVSFCPSNSECKQVMFFHNDHNFYTNTLDIKHKNVVFKDYNGN